MNRAEVISVFDVFGVAEIAGPYKELEMRDGDAGAGVHETMRRLDDRVGKVEVLATQIEPFPVEDEIDATAGAEREGVLRAEQRSEFRRENLFFPGEVDGLAVLRDIQGLIMGVCIPEIIDEREAF